MASPAAAELLKTLPEPERVEKLEITKSTALVLSFPGELPMEHYASLRHTLTGIFPGVKVLILDGGATLQTVELPKSALEETNTHA